MMMSQMFLNEPMGSECIGGSDRDVIIGKNSLNEGEINVFGNVVNRY